MTEMVTVQWRRMATTLRAPRRRTFVDAAPPQERYYVVYLFYRVLNEGLLTLGSVKELMGHVGAEAHAIPPVTLTPKGCNTIIVPMGMNSRGPMGGVADNAVRGLASVPRGMKSRSSLVPLH